jgi:nitroreductase
LDVREAIRSRRSIKRVDPDHRLDPAEVDELLDLAQTSPTAFNIQHCRYVVVTDPLLRQQLRAASFDQPQVTDAALLVVVCGDVQAWRKQPARYWLHVEEPARSRLADMITGFYDGREQMQRDECMRSCGFAAQTLMLAARGLGHDSCPMDGFDVDEVARLVNLPEDHLVSMFVCIGRALEPAPPRGGKLPASEVIVENRF